MTVFLGIDPTSSERKPSACALLGSDGSLVELAKPRTDADRLECAAGCRPDPPVSDPTAIGESRAATAAADPPLEPPGTRSRSQGFRVGPETECSVVEPIANSSQLVFPMTTRPAAR